VANYSFTHAKTSPGGDIPPQQAGQSASQLAALCNNTPGCVGFTSSGWLKSSIKLPVLWEAWTPMGGPANSPAPLSPCDGLFKRTDAPYEGMAAVSSLHLSRN